MAAEARRLMRGLWSALLGALGWLRFALRWARRSVMLLAVLALLATNVLAFASSAFIGAVSSVAALAGLKTAQARQAAARATEAAARREAVKRIGQRTARGAARSLGGTVAQSLPFVGVASVVGITAWEIADACATMQDLAALAPDSVDDPEKVCGLTPPTTAAVYHEIGARAGEWSGAAWRWASGAPPPAP